MKVAKMRRGWLGTLISVRAGVLDAVALGTAQMRSAQNPRKALLILSDGNDNNSRYSESEIRSRVLESDVRVFAIGLMHSPRLLQELAEETGGKVLVARNLAELPDVVQKLSAEIRSLRFGLHVQLGERRKISQRESRTHTGSWA